MLRIDSAIRESLRYSSLGVIAFEREVASPEGLDIGNGIKVPKGTRIGLPMSSIHSDERLYENAESYDPLRFSRPREEYEDSLKALERGEGKVGNGDVKMHGHGREGDKGKRDMKKTLDLKNTSAVTPGEGFLSFGHGRHACPGRYVNFMLPYNSLACFLKFPLFICPILYPPSLSRPAPLHLPHLPYFSS